MKRLLLTTAAFGLIAGAAHAVPIAAGSLLSIDGSDTFTATSVTFFNPANVGAGTATGSFSILSGCTGCVTMSNISTSTVLPSQLYTLTEGAIHSTLSVESAAFNYVAGSPLNNLTVQGKGTLTLTGFDPTEGVYILTTQGPGGTAEVTFSVTADAVPEPASLGLLGVGLLGLGFAARRARR